MVFKLLHQHAPICSSYCCIDLIISAGLIYLHQDGLQIAASTCSSGCRIKIIFKMLHQDGREIADLSASAAIWSSNCCIKVVFKLLIVCPLLHQRSHQDDLQIAASKGGQM